MAARCLIRGTRSALTRTDNLRVECMACVYGHAEHTCGRYVTAAADMSAAALESGATAEKILEEVDQIAARLQRACRPSPEASAIEVQDDMLARAGKL